MIVILMATFNGEKYIAEQIDSLLAQTVQDFVVYIHDDCSTDNTYVVLERYAAQYPGKFAITRNECNTGSAKYNFIQMMVKYKADYVMLCDQDDIWKPDKIEITLAKMQDIEKAQHASCPILVHTDLEVVNEQLQLLSSSFAKMMRLDPSRIKLNQSIVQNVVTGCTTMYNRALADLLDKYPDAIIMHDWWILLIASAFGKVEYVSYSSILYRQHLDNSVGARDTRTLRYKFKRLLNQLELKRAIVETYQQTKSFLSVFEDRLSVEQKYLLKKYYAIASQSKLVRIYSVIKLRTLKYGMDRKIAQLIFI